MRNRIEILAPSKFTGFMKMERSKNTTLASQKKSKAHSPHWYLQRPLKISRAIICANATPQRFHGSGRKCPLKFC